MSYSLLCQHPEHLPWGNENCEIGIVTELSPFEVVQKNCFQLENILEIIGINAFWEMSVAFSVLVFLLSKG